MDQTLAGRGMVCDAVSLLVCKLFAVFEGRGRSELALPPFY